MAYVSKEEEEVDFRHKGDFGRMKNYKEGKKSYKGSQKRGGSKGGESGGQVLCHSCDFLRNNTVENKDQPVFTLALCYALDPSRYLRAQQMSEL